MMKPPPALIFTLSCAALYAQDTQWKINDFSGKSYLSLRSLCQFYRLEVKQESSQGLIAEQQGLRLEFLPTKHEVKFNGMRVELLLPLKQMPLDGWFISRLDFVKIIDPLLRPQYIHQRLRSKHVIIDAALGGSERGNELSDKQTSSAQLLSLGQELGKILQAKGYEVSYTRMQDEFCSNHMRVERANAQASGLFISMRLNRAQAQQSGYALYIKNAEQEVNLNQTTWEESSAAFAMAIGAQVMGSSCQLKPLRSSILHSIEHPGLIISLGNVNNAHEMARLSKAAQRAQLLEQISKGIELGFNQASSASANEAQAAPEQPELIIEYAEDPDA